MMSFWQISIIEKEIINESYNIRDRLSKKECLLSGNARIRVGGK